ncbi:MAG: zinc-ribbon domain-containing protein [Dehalococcoidia bacterium]|nr:MAG: zinc-ribbon domain-containing protein [Dehalococcoidia bacterium]
MADTIKCPTCGKSTIIGSYCEHCGRALNTCPACRLKVGKDAIFCPNCGSLISEERRLQASQQPIPRRWWLLPVFSPLLLVSPWVAGVIAWGFNRDRNPRKARYILFFGILLSIMLAIATAVLGWEIAF